MEDKRERVEARNSGDTVVTGQKEDGAALHQDGSSRSGAKTKTCCQTVE